MILLHHRYSKCIINQLHKESKEPLNQCKPYSEVYLSSLKGSALTLGVSIDLGNTVPSAPVNKRKKQTEVGDLDVSLGGTVSIMNAAKCSESSIQPNTQLFCPWL